MKKILSFDFGASSGRAMISSFDGEKITMEEIHRFSNDTIIVNGTMYWDILRLFFEIKTSITKAVNSGGFDAIGIDTWGVDFGLIDKRGKLLSNPVHYRDLRTEGIPEKVFETISKEEIYNRTGTQCMRINTLYQLMYLKENEPEIFENTEKVLLIPDLFAYMLTGEMRAEASIASTTNLYNPYKRDWDYELIERLGLNKNLFPEIIKAGNIYGYLTDEICEELGCEKVPVIAVCAHDTASAVAATPSFADDFVYISCGTWSLFGIELPEPIINDEVCKLNFTNEGGFKDTVRFLKNIMGLWLIQESRRQWRREGEEVVSTNLKKKRWLLSPLNALLMLMTRCLNRQETCPAELRSFARKQVSMFPRPEAKLCAAFTRVLQ